MSSSGGSEYVPSSEDESSEDGNLLTVEEICQNLVGEMKPTKPILTPRTSKKEESGIFRENVGNGELPLCDPVLIEPAAFEEPTTVIDICDALSAQADDSSPIFDQAISQLTCDELCDEITKIVQGFDSPEMEPASDAVAQPVTVEINTTFRIDSQNDLPCFDADTDEMVSPGGEHQDDSFVPVQHPSPLTVESPMGDAETFIEEGESSGSTVTRKNHSTKRNEAKTSRMLGESYVGFRRGCKGSTKLVIQDVDRGPRKMGPPCTSEKCVRMCDKIAEDDRKEMFDSFWKKMKSWDEKRMFVCSTIDVHLTKRKTTTHDSRRKYSLSYFLKIKDKKLQVCKLMYLNTMGLKKSEVGYWIDKYLENNYPRANSLNQKPNELDENDAEDPGDDAAGNVGINEEGDTNDQPRASINGHLTGQSRRARKHKVEFLTEFLRTLPKLPSHYCRKSSTKLYLQTEMRSVAQLYSLYEEKCTESGESPLRRTWFDKIFRDMNLGIFSPRKDMCDVCYSYNAGNLDEETYKQHIAKKNRARTEKENDKKQALEAKCHVICNDLMAVQMVPLIRASAAYYKLKLSVHNFTVYDLRTRDSLNYWFDETGTTLCASTFASFLVDYVSELIDGSKLPVIIYSDGCTYQNRNAILANALLHLSVQKQVRITQKFLEKGHTQFECDSVHSAIERKYMNVDVHIPSQFCLHTARARQNPGPYRTRYVDFSFFKDFSQQSTMVYPTIRPGKRPGDPTVTDLRVINYHPDGTITYKLNFDDEETPMPMPRMRREIRPCSFPALHERRLPIPYDKWQDLQALKALIPSDCHAFYDALPHTSQDQSIRALKRKKQQDEPSGSKKKGKKSQTED